MTQPFLPYGRQAIDEDDIAAVAAVLRSDYLTTGPAVAAFEAQLQESVDAPYAVACSSATAGLHLAAMALGLGPGDAVVVPAVTFLASANAARYVGADVVFADVDPDSGLTTPELLEQAISRAGRPVKAVFPVQLAGQAADPVEIAAVAARAGAVVVEDACHALGATYRRGNEDVKIGACRDAAMAVFSFHPVKTVAMGEGGAVTTRDEGLARKLSTLRSHGMVRQPEDFRNAELALGADGRPNPWYYEMPEPGYNYRASDIHCALGASQLRKLGAFVEARRKLVAAYDERIARFPADLVRPLARAAGCGPAWHLYVVLIDFAALGRDRGDVMRELHRRGIGTQVHYIPVPWQPYYQALYGRGDYPGAARYYERCLSLPLFASLGEDDVDRVVDGLADVLGLR